MRSEFPFCRLLAPQLRSHAAAPGTFQSRTPDHTRPLQYLPVRTPGTVFQCRARPIARVRSRYLPVADARSHAAAPDLSSRGRPITRVRSSTFQSRTPDHTRPLQYLPVADARSHALRSSTFQSRTPDHTRPLQAPIAAFPPPYECSNASASAAAGSLWIATSTPPRPASVSKIRPSCC